MTFSPGEGGGTVPQAGVRKQRGKQGSWAEDGVPPKRQHTGTSEEDWEMPGITVEEQSMWLSISFEALCPANPIPCEPGSRYIPHHPFF